MNKDLLDIQEMLAHQDSQIQDLSSVMIAQGKEIDALKQQITHLKHKIQTADSDNENISANPANQKPPHY